LFKANGDDEMTRKYEIAKRSQSEDKRRHDIEIFETGHVPSSKRRLTLEEVEEALRDQYDLHVQDDITFEWDIRQGSFIDSVSIIHVERTTEEQ
jgi:hypothetical protein